MATTNRAVAPRYATALYQAAADEATQTRIREDLNQLKTIVSENPGLLPALASKNLAASQQEELRQMLTADAQPLTKRLLEVLAGNGRIAGLIEVIEAYNNLYSKEQGIVEATVTTVVPLEDSQKDSLTRAIVRKLGVNDVTLVEHIDPSIVGGVKVVAGDSVIDGTVKTRLAKLQAQLQSNN